MYNHEKNRLYMDVIVVGSRKITSCKLIVLAKALASGNCPKGLSIDLEYNKIGPKGAEVLAGGLCCEAYEKRY